MPHFLGVVDMIKVGDKVKLIAYQCERQWEKEHGANVGGVYEVNDVRSQKTIGINTGKNTVFTQDKCLEIYIKNPNRQYLEDFLKLNNIKKTLVSKALGKSENWLTQMANDTRRDMTEETLQRILKMLHIDWSSDKTLHVKTKGYVPYTTKPCTYHTDMHKERLQRAFWNGEVTV